LAVQSPDGSTSEVSELIFHESVTRAKNPVGIVQMLAKMEGKGQPRLSDGFDDTINAWQREHMTSAEFSLEIPARDLAHDESSPLSRSSIGAQERRDSIKPLGEYDENAIPGYVEDFDEPSIRYCHIRHCDCVPDHLLILG
jgi:hypothetical protein